MTRLLVTNVIYLYQKIFFLPKDLEPAVNFGDHVLGHLSFLRKFIYEFPLPVGYSLNIHGLVFQSPLIGASFKSDKKTLDAWLRMGLGGLIFKTIMRESRSGNPRPRLQDMMLNGDRGLVNALGLPGPGIDEFIGYLPRSDLWSKGRPLGISVGGDHIDDYLSSIKLVESSLTQEQSNYFYELNISCPNTENGLTIGDDPEKLNDLLSNIREEVSKVISVKVSPDTPNMTLNKIGEICSSHQRLIINTGNTQFKTRDELGLSKTNFSMNGGGLSGSALFTRTLEMVKIFSGFDIPIMATGGISNINHINALQNAGASLFGMATSLVLDPYCVPRINRKLKENVHDRTS